VSAHHPPVEQARSAVSRPAPAPPPLADADRALLLEQLASTRTGHGIPDDLVGPTASRRSPTCGDRFTVAFVLDGAGDAAVVRAAHWTGHGCTVSTAAAVALAETATGLTVAAVRELAALQLAAVEPGAVADERLEFGAAFAGIGRFPLRAGCATLAWRAAVDALASPQVE
jgi:NifU-like protein involved in Fe-S cluster formation